jgi:ATP-binding cassette, subfamily F, member 3
MAVLIASSLRKEFSGDALFDGVSFKLERGDRLALAGPNGAGKTTLLRALIGETELAGGELAWEKGARAALHDQRPPRLGGFTLHEYTLSGASDLVATERELRRLEEAMAAGDHGPETLRRYGEAQARLEHAGGYGWRDHATAVLRGLGFADAELDRGLETFSGGELTRASLARALAGGPDLLLLDEPTNHLDMASMEWLEQELATIDAAVILVAHDRWFLEAVATSVLELEGGRSVFFPGKWHVWRQEKAARLANQATWAQRQAEDIARLERFVARFRYGTKSRQAQAKLKQIARIEAERVEAPTSGRRTLGFEFLKPVRSGRLVIEAEGFDLAAGTKPLLRDAELVLERGEHVALIGPNGSGKSTLLEGIVAGEIGRLGHGVELAYFSQHEVELDERGSVLECTMGATGLQRPQAQALLGRFLFSGWDAHEKRVDQLSGGERRRLALALIVASGSNFLVLDEPTNHLDLESREAPCCSSRTIARSSTPLRSESSRSRTRVSAPIQAAGPTTPASGPTRTQPQRRRRRSARRSRGPRSRSLPGAASSTWSSPRSRSASSRSPISSGGWPRTGPTPRRSPHTRRPATSCRACSSAGSSCSSPRSRCEAVLV